ncbi:MAG TPA: helix-turn-helix domain-containing protein [Solirubrobacteraceae bacterium]|nr:helix-turn-helix domain-containing protein [Solirubrobacteraceae bacterium]
MSRTMVAFVASLGRQSEKRVAIEASVLRATEELLEEGASFAELGIERIATRAGISRTAFYFYFRDKRELLVRLTEEVNAELVAAASTWWSGSSDLRSALREIASLYREHGALLRAVVEVSTYDEEVARFWRALVGRFAEPTRERIEADGGNPALAGATAFALVWMVERSFYQQLVQREPVEMDELVDAMATIFEKTVSA